METVVDNPVYWSISVPMLPHTDTHAHTHTTGYLFVSGQLAMVRRNLRLCGPFFKEVVLSKQ